MGLWLLPPEVLACRSEGNDRIGVVDARKRAVSSVGRAIIKAQLTITITTDKKITRENRCVAELSVCCGLVVIVDRKTR